MSRTNVIAELEHDESKATLRESKTIVKINLSKEGEMFGSITEGPDGEPMLFPRWGRAVLDWLGIEY